MGEVFRATDELLGRQVAVKLLLPTERDPRAADRFHREARAAARLNDPHVVAVYDFGRHEDGFFLVMELVEGGTIAQELTEHGTLPIDRAVEIVEQSAAGLATAHQNDVVHRDVKPGNLLVAPDGTVKVADFGIAHLPGEGASTLTATGQIIGSSLYLAPERARGEQGGKAADVYALGCVLYQLITGQPPFTAELPTAILYQHVDTAPVPPSTIRPELSGPYEGTLLRMLAKDPADRPTAAEIAAGALRTAPLGGAVVAAAPGPAGPTAPFSALQTQEPPNHRRRKAVLIGAIAFIAAAATGVGIALLNANDSQPPATNDLGPRPSVSTPATAPTATQPGTSSQPTSAPPSSTQPTASPTSTPSSPSPTTTPSPTPTPTPTPSSTPSNTPTPSATPSSTPSPEDPPTSTPPANTPSPD